MRLYLTSNFRQTNKLNIHRFYAAMAVMAGATYLVIGLNAATMTTIIESCENCSANTARVEVRRP